MKINNKIDTIYLLSNEQLIQFLLKEIHNEYSPNTKIPGQIILDAIKTKSIPTGMRPISLFIVIEEDYLPPMQGGSHCFKGSIEVFDRLISEKTAMACKQCWQTQELYDWELSKLKLWHRQCLKEQQEDLRQKQLKTLLQEWENSWKIEEKASNQSLESVEVSNDWFDLCGDFFCVFVLVSLIASFFRPR